MKDDTHLTETPGPAVKKAETMPGDPCLETLKPERVLLIVVSLDYSHKASEVPSSQKKWTTGEIVRQQKYREQAL